MILAKMRNSSRIVFYCTAVVGDGAVGGTGTECAGDSRIRVTFEKGMDIECPQAMLPTAILR